MRWKAALPFLAPIGNTFHCMGPSGVDITVQHNMVCKPTKASLFVK